MSKHKIPNTDEFERQVSTVINKHDMVLRRRDASVAAELLDEALARLRRAHEIIGRLDVDVTSQFQATNKACNETAIALERVKILVKRLPR